MGKTYAMADDEAVKLLRGALQEWHAELAELQVRLELLMVSPPTNKKGEVTGPALTKHGHAAVATIRLPKACERRIGLYDAVILVDAPAWAQFTPANRLAVLDHELEHLVMQRDQGGSPMLHADGRPRLALRPDDWCFTGFASVVARHGPAAIETLALRWLHKNVQGLFDFMTEDVPETPGERTIAAVMDEEAAHVQWVEVPAPEGGKAAEVRANRGRRRAAATEGEGVTMTAEVVGPPGPGHEMLRAVAAEINQTANKRRGRTRRPAEVVGS